MFTGIIEEIGTVSEIIPVHDSLQVIIQALKVCEGTRIGDSISLAGTCVTVTSIAYDSFSADLSSETVEKTNFKRMRPGDRVNLERALTLASRMGGHFVTGHIDGTGIIESIRKEKNFWRYSFKAEHSLLKYIPSKGSVTLDGVSLTPIDCTKETFSVMMIPHTVDSTTFKLKHSGDSVNIECDILGKYIERLIQFDGGTEIGEPSNKIDADFLRKTGFLI